LATRRHHSDKGDARPETPTEPNGWDELATRVRVRGALHLHDPATFPRIKIGRFDAQVKIGRGGFGIVFKAFDPKLKRWVALKLCLTRSEAAIEELMNEARVLAELNHPNIVSVLEPGEYEGSAFFAMPYIDGQNAREFAKRTPRPTWREVLDVFIGVASGLAAAHGARPPIVHGDVKPSNILLDLDDFARIADFGLGRRMIEDADESEQEGLRHRAGTLYYMAPEVLRGEDGDALSDQWSFCISLKQTLDGGVLPFIGDSSAEMLEDIGHTEVQFEDPSIPKEILAVLRIGLSEDPRDRFPDMKTLRAELVRLRQSPLDESELDEAPPRDDTGPDEPPPHETTPDKPPPDAPPSPLGEWVPDQPELTPVGGGPEPSKAIDNGPPWEINPNVPVVVRRGVSIERPSSLRRTASWIAFGVALGGTLAGGLALLVLGPASDATASVDVELPEPSKVTKPIELPYPHNLTSPCAMGDEEMSIADEELLETCTRIRNGQLVSADTGWDKAVNKRLSGDRVALIEATLIVARTFVDHAIVTQHAGPEDAAEAARLGDRWAVEAAYWIDPREGLNDPRVSPIRTRAKPLLPP
jgi:serine/threonine protein kinase